MNREIFLLLLLYWQLPQSVIRFKPTLRICVFLCMCVQEHNVAHVEPVSQL